ncbi:MULTISPECIES: T9SS sorting signal type C domain-containing protein [Flavobacterium]|uniref:T9SS type A sorting domain-containing protein n=1 Tax=Flavobacterium endoglycinae TaxID=2816357 RepID=A0ABX7QEA4_9FLAO|nr:T9SS sorting signal type C domain-containing protein [Flavobacterium endoglycinae]QSW88923.1 T9SS type A sorting domain-containing protein [Flavobacterium endoglycinae]
MKKLFFSFILLLAAQYVISLNSNPFLSKPLLKENAFLKFKDPAPEFKSALEVERHRVWLNLTNPEGLFKQLLIGYITGATNGWDHQYDAPTIDGNVYADFYSINEDRKLVIQGRAVPFDPSDIVPLGYRSSIIGNLTISIDHADGILETRDIFLKDKVTGKLHNLKKGSYTFSTLAGVFQDRFVLFYDPDIKLGMNDDVKNNLQPLFVTSKDKVISLKSESAPLQEVAVYDISGKILFSSQKIGAPQLEINSIDSGSQILLVKTTLENGLVMTRKVLF